MESEQIAKLTPTTITDFSDADKEYISRGADDVEKAYRQNLIVSALALNGAFDAAEPGIATSYLDENEYFIWVEDHTVPQALNAVVEQALNWLALGKGKGGLAGACVRYSMRSYFKPTREFKKVTKVTKDHTDLATEYAKYSNTHSKFAGVWYANAWNVLGLSASCFIRECHHWNSQNLKPIKALLGSINQDNDLAESEYRKLFYLAIHPLPLDLYGEVYNKASDLDDKDLSEVVRQRLNVAPAGYADFCACAIAARSFELEDFANRSRIIIDVKKLINAADHIKKNPLSYHPFSTQMGVEHETFEKTPYNEVMIILTAYTRACIGGTLANSPALIKFAENNLRRINKLAKSFKDYSERKSEDLMKILVGEEEIDYDNIVEKIKPIAKLAERLKNMSDDKEGALIEASRKLEEKISSLVDKLGDDVGKDINLDNIDLPFKDGARQPTRTVPRTVGGITVPVSQKVVQ